MSWKWVACAFVLPRHTPIPAKTHPCIDAPFFGSSAANARPQTAGSEPPISAHPTAPRCSQQRFVESPVGTTPGTKHRPSSSSSKDGPGDAQQLRGRCVQWVCAHAKHPPRLQTWGSDYAVSSAASARALAEAAAGNGGGDAARCADAARFDRSAAQVPHTPSSSSVSWPRPLPARFPAARARGKCHASCPGREIVGGWHQQLDGGCCARAAASVCCCCCYRFAPAQQQRHHQRSKTAAMHRQRPARLLPTQQLPDSQQPAVCPTHASSSRKADRRPPCSQRKLQAAATPMHTLLLSPTPRH